MKSNKKLKNKINRRIKEHEYVLENTDCLIRSNIHTNIEIRDMIKETRGKIYSLYWVLEQIETKKKKTSDYEGCKSYTSDC